jgi:hypothetical protein
MDALCGATTGDGFRIQSRRIRGKVHYSNFDIRFNFLAVFANLFQPPPFNYAPGIKTRPGVRQNAFLEEAMKEQNYEL